MTKKNVLLVKVFVACFHISVWNYKQLQIMPMLTNKIQMAWDSTNEMGVPSNTVMIVSLIGCLVSKTLINYL